MWREIILICQFILVIYGNQCSLPGDEYRVDCFPQPNANQNDCLARGCCWSPPSSSKRVLHQRKFRDSLGPPYCYYPLDFPTYQTKSLAPTDRGFKANLYKTQSSFLPKEILNLNFEVIYETETRVRIRITDPNVKRFEIPIKLGPPDSTPPANPQYEVVVSPNNSSFYFEVKRRSDGLSLFRTFGPLLYSDQFIQISSLLSTDHAYGMGEQDRPLMHNLADQWTRIGLWARDFAVAPLINLYGTHPFYMGMPDNGQAFGVYYLNCNAQEFNLQPAPAITYRTTGGILDIFVLTGGSPTETTRQYLELIGNPMLPPFWSLGFHLSRWGYTNISHITNVLQRNLKANIPIDVQWSDIDYMDAYKDFTYDPVNYPNMGDFLRQLRQQYHIRYVTIIEPAIGVETPGTYDTYDEGLKMNVFIRDYLTNKPLVGKVWPGQTVFVDYTNPNATQYWTKQFQSFYKSVPVDGLWTDMNEPSNLVDGSMNGCPGNSTYDYPFFTPAIRDTSLIKATICPSGLQYNDIPHYNWHNAYGYTQSIVTNQALVNTIQNKRPFILSRSSFSGSGRYTFHWTGDNTADWSFLSNSIRQILNFNLFGIPMTGADVCGFVGDATEELCIRWMQLGSFYPFMRNHNTIGARDQDPAAWSEKAQRIMQNSLMVRYMILPYFYTVFVRSHLYGETVMRPLSYEFPTDHQTHGIDLQFMIGPAILVNPVTTQGATSVRAYFPAGVWYDLSGALLYSGKSGSWLNLDAPLEVINVAIRAGYVIAAAQPALNTDLLRKNNITIACILSEDQTAAGELYWDDGESLDSYTSSKFTHVTFRANSTGIVIKPVATGYQSTPSLISFSVIGLNRTSVTSVTLNGKPLQFSFISEKQILVAQIDFASLLIWTNIQWS